MFNHWFAQGAILGSVTKSVITLLKKGGRHVWEVLDDYRPITLGLGMPDLESHWLAERLAYLGRSLTGDSVWRRKASRTFPHLKSDAKAEGRRKPLGEALFFCECRKALRNLLESSDLSRPRKQLYREVSGGFRF